MIGRMNMSREAVVRYVAKANDSRSHFRFPTVSAIAHGLGFETVDRARTHVRYAEWAGWIEREGLFERAATYRVTDAGRAALAAQQESDR